MLHRFINPGIMLKVQARLGGDSELNDQIDPFLLGWRGGVS